MYHIPNQSNTVYASMVLKMSTMTEAGWNSANNTTRSTIKAFCR